jgi:hypothetical protein
LDHKNFSRKEEWEMKEGVTQLLPKALITLKQPPLKMIVMQYTGTSLEDSGVQLGKIQCIIVFRIVLYKMIPLTWGTNSLIENTRIPAWGLVHKHSHI